MGSGASPEKRVDRMLGLILDAERRIRPLPPDRWAQAIRAEHRRLRAIGETDWTARHVAYCLEERLLTVHKQQGCGARISGGHECIHHAAHAGAHRCACGRDWPRRA